MSASSERLNSLSQWALRSGFGPRGIHTTRTGEKFKLSLSPCAVRICRLDTQNGFGKGGFRLPTEQWVILASARYSEIGFVGDKICGLRLRRGAWRYKPVRFFASHVTDTQTFTQSQLNLADRS